MRRPVSAMGVGRPAPPRAGTTAALKGVALAPRPGGEGVSLRAEQAAPDNPAKRRAPPDRAASRRTVAAARVCKDARVDRAPALRGLDNAPN
jgi:hypothetical protein